MTHNTDSARREVLPPDEAFSALGNDIRIRILQTLGETDGPVSFTELRNAVGLPQGRQFNYHLEQLVGHFVVKTDEGYRLRQAGRRVVMAVLSGAITDAPVVERTAINVGCPHCDAPVEVQYVPGRVEYYCTDCSGTYGARTLDVDESVNEGFIGQQSLPPSGIQRRTPLEMAQAGALWGTLQFLATANGVCPYCSARLDISPVICTNHDATSGLCDRCNHRYAVRREQDCTNCIFSVQGVVALSLLTHPALLTYQLDHGVNPVSPQDLRQYARLTVAYEEEVLSVDPLMAALTFSLDGESLTLTVNDDLDVVSVTKNRASSTS